MKNYRINLNSTGGMTQLPDSQKIFGALVTMFADLNGNEDATDFVKAIFNKKIHLTLSNVFPSDYFPMPQDFIVDRLSNTVSDSQTAKERRTAVKERMYVKMCIRDRAILYKRCEQK